MGNRFKHREEQASEPTQSELWSAWEPHSLLLSNTFTKTLGLERKTDVYNWLYELGIQPDRYLIRKSEQYGVHIEIRFLEKADLAWIQMSGHADEDKLL